MATRLFTRSILTTKQTITSVLSRSYASLSLSTPPSSLSASYILRLRPLVAASASFRHLSPLSATIRGFSTRQTTSSLNDQNPNWSNRPPKETILLDGCDFEHWLIVMEKPEGDPTRDDIIDSYIKTLAQVIGSEEEARMKIYSVSTKHYWAFGALVSEELSYKIKELPRVRWVLPDSYLDVKNKDYGGEPFINGQAVPYDPKYHEEWVRNNTRANERNRRNDRPRNFDRSRNFERRRDNMQNRGPNMGGGPPGNMGGAPNAGGGPPGNMGGVPPNNTGGGGPNMQPNYQGGGPNMQPNYQGGGPNRGGMPPNYQGGGPNMGGMPPSNMGGAPNMGGQGNNMGGPPNWGGMHHNNTGGAPNNAPNYQYNNGPGNEGMPYQSREMPGPGPNRDYQNSYAPNMAGENPQQTQNMPGRDMPPPPNYR
ncbi:multiple organellar RNA editing factor 8, chloroplastic/mitochondrial-like [Cornus florida]|uniref:multiple organellar RNA editing factor 8, chloroplastic/mitochondrial-like n=1 Tax=Cornus florida TaxID=4283 RepID=UPI0028A0683E|nr:multiple organellar RNA editing factor 8, chloroplastic/mitochondrial-like [Cornus florida]